ncbi:glycosyltransferase family 2 protein [Gracilimonas sp. BCB1]|uniref:glycosyltransferase family 2 protein n=1 Tax=Gracilimonas sp. BCB1 TaxID=3152362 RepID=UPI0032D9A6FD
MSLVSVIIPSFNRVDLVERAIQSVIDQSYPEVEIIVIDDASDVDIRHRVEGLPGVKYYRNKENRGACYSRNRGIQEAKGEYINFLDDDDVLLPTKLETQVECFKQSNDPDLGMVTCHANDGRSGEFIIRENKVKGDIYNLLLNRFSVSGIETMLFKTDFIREIGGFDENLQSSQEYDLLIRFAEHYTVDYVDEVLTKEFRSVNQISTNFDKKIQGARYLYKKHDHRFREKGFLFWLKMKSKLQMLILRFYVGKVFGEKMYRMLLR